MVFLCTLRREGPDRHKRFGRHQQPSPRRDYDTKTCSVKIVCDRLKAKNVPRAESGETRRLCAINRIDWADI
jgi:hypothetical protein